MSSRSAGVRVIATLGFVGMACGSPTPEARSSVDPPPTPAAATTQAAPSPATVARAAAQTPSGSPTAVDPGAASPPGGSTPRAEGEGGAESAAPSEEAAPGASEEAAPPASDAEASPAALALLCQSPELAEDGPTECRFLQDGITLRDGTRADVLEVERATGAKAAWLVFRRHPRPDEEADDPIVDVAPLAEASIESDFSSEYEIGPLQARGAGVRVRVVVRNISEEDPGHPDVERVTYRCAISDDELLVCDR